MRFKRIFSAVLALLLVLSAWGCARNGGSAETVLSTGSTAPLTVTVTLPEGLTLVQIFQKLEDNGVCSFDALMNAAETGDFSAYPLIAAVSGDKNKAFVLEGYLFPDTYEFYHDDTPENVIGKFLSNAESRITEEMRQRAKKLGYSMDEILTVASIIQEEGDDPAEVKKIAGVIYNRLDDGDRLQMDTTINYIEQSVKPYITGDTDRYNALYNTYKCKALPAGPICNPGLLTIEAALYPADVPYYFFCYDDNGKYYYAETYKEHLENCEAAGIN